VVRIVVTRGSSVPGVAGDPLVIVFGHGWDRQDRPARLFPLTAPWHAAGHGWELAGAKITSYAPNMASTRRAVEEGYDDALLLTVDGVVLEGPTFAVAWVVDGVVETPGLVLGILDSITRRVVLELCEETGIPVVEVEAPLDRLRQASEVMAWSTVREVQPVGAVGDLEFETGPITRSLYEAFAGAPRREPGRAGRR
jgi:branched-subunit amino acid aminotransferase/4-amino-4-deoxychorismate lyase